MLLDMYIAVIADRTAFAMILCTPKVLAALKSFEILLRVVNMETTTSLMWSIVFVYCLAACQLMNNLMHTRLQLIMSRIPAKTMK
jgi:hypothetical protein